MLWVCDWQPHPHPPGRAVTQRPESDPRWKKPTIHILRGPAQPVLGVVGPSTEPSTGSLSPLVFSGWAVDTPGLALLPSKPERNSCAPRLRKYLMDNTRGDQGEPGMGCSFRVGKTC